MADAPRNADASKRVRARQLGVLALVALGVAFAVLNLDEVGVNWIVTTRQTPLIVVIAASVVVGAGIGFLIGRRRRSE